MFDTQTKKKVAVKCLGTSKMQFWHIIVKMTLLSFLNVGYHTVLQCSNNVRLRTNTELRMPRCKTLRLEVLKGNCQVLDQVINFDKSFCISSASLCD